MLVLVTGVAGFIGAALTLRFPDRDDIAGGVVNFSDYYDVSLKAAAPKSARGYAPCRIFLVGDGQPVPLLRFIAALVRRLGRKAGIGMLPMQPGNVPATVADVSQLESAVGYRPKTPVEAGLPKFVDWYRSNCGVAG